MYKKIRAKKDLYNAGKCFTKGIEYQLPQSISTAASLLEMRVINDHGQPHIIGSWWREFTLVR